MDRAAIVEELKTLISELGVALPPGGLDASTALFEGGLALDSFDVVELLAKIEARFSIEFGDDDLRPEHFVVGTLAALVEARVESTS